MTLNTTPINPTDSLEILKRISELPNPPSVMLHGPPGVGKSSIVYQLAEWRAKQENFSLTSNGNELPKDATILFSDIRLSTLESPGELKGLPYPNGERVKYLRPGFIPPNDNRPHILFLDELTSADQRIQSAAYQILLDRRIGDHFFGPRTFVIAAGNPIEYGAIANLGAAISDRLIHLNVTATPESWLKWAKENDIAHEVLTFIQVRPDFLDMSETRIRKNLTIAASPRGWARVSRILKHFHGQPATAGLEKIISGIVGQEAAGEFFLVLEELQDAVDVRRLMETKGTRHLPQTLTALYGICYALPPLITNAETLESAFEILLQIKETPNPNVPNEEIATLGFEMAIERGEKLGLMKHMIASKAFKRYSEIRRAQGLQ